MGKRIIFKSWHYSINDGYFEKKVESVDAYDILLDNETRDFGVFIAEYSAKKQL